VSTDFSVYLSEACEKVNSELERRLLCKEIPTDLRNAMSHLVFPGGKRLRPVLAMAACEAAGGQKEDAIQAAAAIEFLHIYSLIHDDLPCMDDDETRRGRPTVHVKYGEALAVLAGDALQALAFETLTVPAAAWGLGAVSDLASAGGGCNLVGGQADDLAMRGDELQNVGLTDRIRSIHSRKTAALFGASASIGARCAVASEKARCRLESFGRHLGLAFQIGDDCVDSDKEESCTILRVRDERGARELADEHLRLAAEEMAGFSCSAEPIRCFLRFVAEIPSR
jgi:geranylgeranyl pyrophosphate synthase